MNIIRNLPISLWREELPKHGSLLNGIHQLQLSDSAFRVAALDLDAALTQFARASNARRGYAANMDRPLVSYVIGSLQGFRPDDILPWINLGLERANGWLEEGRIAALADVEIVASHRKFAECRQSLVAKIEVLVKELDA